MNAKVYQLESSEQPPMLLDSTGIEVARNNVTEAAKSFKNSWRSLARALQVVWKEKLYIKWGYDNFDQYTAKEARVRKHTAMKLIRSHMFLESECPQKIAPTLEMTSVLANAKKKLNEDEYKKVKKDLLDEGKEPREVKKGVAELIMKHRKEVNPEAERTRRNKTAITRFLSVLRAFKKDIETLKILPGVIVEDIEALNNKIEEYIPEEIIDIEKS